MKLYDFLDKQLDKVISWLNYAEAKLAAIIALNIAIFAAVTSIESLNLLLKIAVDFFIGVSFVIGLIGLFPKSKTSKFQNQSPNKNLLFYKYIACMSDGNEYINKIQKSYNFESADINHMIKGEKYSQIELDCATEIVENSNIIVRKNRLFSATVFLDIISLVIFCISVFVSYKLGKCPCAQ